MSRRIATVAPAVLVTALVLTLTAALTYLLRGEVPRSALDAGHTAALRAGHTAALRAGHTAALRAGHGAPLDAEGLRAPLHLRSGPRVLVVAGDGPAAERDARLARRALGAVRRRLPAWRGLLVVEAPVTARGFREATGGSAADARAVAAMTGPSGDGQVPGGQVPGGQVQDSALQVTLNPRVFDLLGPAAQQVVLTHEATHVAVAALLDAGTTPQPGGRAASRTQAGAGPRPVPLWLSEGFADHVALAGTRRPVALLAAQALAAVRRDGPPRALPDAEDFTSANPDVGAAYEASWVAVRRIAATSGERAPWTLYRVASRIGIRRAFRVVLGTGLSAFTAGWRHELQQLAS